MGCLEPEFQKKRAPVKPTCLRITCVGAFPSAEEIEDAG